MSEIAAIVVDVSDKDFPADAKYAPDGDTSIGGQRTNVKVNLTAEPAVIQFLGVSDPNKIKIWGGGYGHRSHREYLYLTQLTQGAQVQVKKAEKSDNFYMVVPEGWIAGATPPPQPEAVSNGQPVEPKTMPAPTPGEFLMLAPSQRLQALLRLTECKWLWSQAYKAIQDVTEGVSPDQLAASATTLFIEITPWKIRQDGGALSPTGHRDILEPRELYKMLDDEVKSKGSMERSPSMQTATVAILSKLFTERERHAFTERMFKVKSTKDLTGAQQSAIITWSGADIKTGWRPSPPAVVEAGLLKEVL